MIPDDSNRLPVNTKILIRFFSKIKISPNITFNGTPCWLWTRELDEKGYARFRYATKQWHGRAHNVSYKMFIGPIPDGLEIDHLCRRRHCVNPVHLEAVTYWTNQLRGVGTLVARTLQTHCKYGHEFTPENTYPMPHGGRQCRICRKIQNAEWHRKNPTKQYQYSKKYLARKHQGLVVTKIKGPQTQPY